MGKRLVSVGKPCLLLAMMWARLGAAQNTHGVAGDAAHPAGVLTANYVKTGLYVISGAGGNSVLRLSANGLLVVDGNHAENFDELRRKIRRLNEQPVRVVVNTDHLEEHTGTNAQFLAAGARILGQQNEKALLESYNPPGGKIAPPTDTFDREQKLAFGPVEVQLHHFGNGRTSADTVVYFPDLKVIAVGDLYAASPNPDYAAGGSLVGWGAALGEVLKLDFTVAVPGRGDAVPRAELEGLKAKIDTVVARGRVLVSSGVGKDKLMAGLKTDDPGLDLKFSPEQVDGFYRELAAVERSQR